MDDYEGYPQGRYRDFEFNEEQNGTIRLIAILTAIVAVAWMVTMGIGAVLSLLSFSLLGVVVSLALLSVGWQLWQASRSFSRVVNTEGTDISHLIQAFSSLTTYFKVKAILMGFVFVVGFVFYMIVGGGRV